MSTWAPTAAFDAESRSAAHSVVALVLVFWGWLLVEVSSLTPVGTGLWWTGATLAYAAAFLQSLVVSGVSCAGITYAYHRFHHDERVPVHTPSPGDFAPAVGITALTACVAVTALPQMLGVPLSGTAPFVIDGPLAVGSTAVPATTGQSTSTGSTPLSHVGTLVETAGLGTLFHGSAVLVSGLASGLLFHGVLQRELASVHSTPAAIGGTALVVAVLSAALEGVPALVVLLAVGLTAGYAFHLTGTLLVPMVTYGLSNVVFYAVHVLAYVAHVRALP